MTPLTPDQIKSLKPGDRVRITVEGEISPPYQEGHVSIVLDGALSGDFNLISHVELTAPTASVTLLSPPVDEDVLIVREIMHAQQRSMEPPPSGWGDMSSLKSSYHQFQAALVAFKAANARSNS